jgi:hypothetical protein
MNIFEQAVRQQIRLNVAGNISIEQLYSAKPTSSFISVLENYEEELTNELSKLEKPSRRHNVAKSNQRKELELKLTIITSYLDEQESIRKDIANKRVLKEKEDELLSLIAEKQKEVDKGKTLEELQAELNNLRTT